MTRVHCGRASTSTIPVPFSPPFRYAADAGRRLPRYLSAGNWPSRSPAFVRLRSRRPILTGIDMTIPRGRWSPHGSVGSGKTQSGLIAGRCARRPAHQRCRPERAQLDREGRSRCGQQRHASSRRALTDMTVYETSRLHDASIRGDAQELVRVWCDEADDVGPACGTALRPPRFGRMARRVALARAIRSTPCRIRRAFAGPTHLARVVGHR